MFFCSMLRRNSLASFQIFYFRRHLCRVLHRLFLDFCHSFLCLKIYHLSFLIKLVYPVDASLLQWWHCPALVDQLKAHWDFKTKLCGAAAASQLNRQNLA